MYATDTPEVPDIALCGARPPEAERRGGKHPDPGDRQGLACTLADGHDGDHCDASGQTWPQWPNLTPRRADCGALPPGPSTPACPRPAGPGHDSPRHNTTDRAWADPSDPYDPGDRCGPCEMCGSPHGPYATVTDVAADRHRQLCQPCARSSRPAARRPLRMCVRCDVLTDSPVLVSEVHQASGPGWNVYACSDCASHFPPLPDVLDLFPCRREQGER